MTKRQHKLIGGPFNAKIVYLSDDGTSTVTFGLKEHYGRYTGTGGELYWQSIQHKDKEDVMKAQVLNIKTQEQPVPTPEPKTDHKYSFKRLATETLALSRKVGANIAVEEMDGHKVIFRNAWGKEWKSVPMTVQEAKFYLFGYRQGKGVNDVK